MQDDVDAINTRIANLDFEPNEQQQQQQRQQDWWNGLGPIHQGEMKRSVYQRYQQLRGIFEKEANSEVSVNRAAAAQTDMG